MDLTVQSLVAFIAHSPFLSEVTHHPDGPIFEGKVKGDNEDVTNRNQIGTSRPDVGADGMS
jgi:hypothetical protein